MKLTHIAVLGLTVRQYLVEYEYIGSIANEFGHYGNEFSSDSIFNEFARYGSEFSSTSAYNEYASKPPIMIDSGLNFIGYLTSSNYKLPSITPTLALYCAKESFKSPVSSHEDLTFKNIDDLNSATGTANIDIYVYCKYTYGDGSFGFDGKCMCQYGYDWNSANTACIKVSSCSDLVNGYLGNDGICYCNNGYLWNEVANKCIKQEYNCNTYGVNVYLANDNLCYCKTGYEWNSSMTSCVVKVTPNVNLFQRPTNTVIIPEVINSFISTRYNRKVFTDRPNTMDILGAMVKGETDPATYVVDANGELRWMKTEEVAKRLFGTQWDSYITWFSDSIIYTYKIGEPIYE